MRPVWGFALPQYIDASHIHDHQGKLEFCCPGGNCPPNSTIHEYICLQTLPDGTPHGEWYMGPARGLLGLHLGLSPGQGPDVCEEVFSKLSHS
jgi:hypothetical protein